MGWFSSIFGSGNNEFVEMENAAEEVGGLNFKTAVEAHMKWKLRLKGVIDGTSTEVLDPGLVSKDDECVLGKWLYSEGGKKFGAFPAFNDVLTTHAQFHKCAGHTLELALAGKTDEAEKELSHGEFPKASLTVIRHLLRLWKDVGGD